VLPLGSPSFSISVLKTKRLAVELGSGRVCDNVAPHAQSPPNFPHSENQAKIRRIAPQYITAPMFQEIRLEFVAYLGLPDTACDNVGRSSFLQALSSFGRGFDSPSISRDDSIWPYTASLTVFG
jgi:hypothetical protein